MDFNALAEKFRQSDSIAIFGHMNPDGDSIGAMLAMAHILENHFGKKNIRLLSRDGVPPFLRFLPGSDRIVSCAGEPAGEKADLSLLVDCGSTRRVGEGMSQHVENAKAIAVIDHHATNSGFGDVNITDPDASSTCEIICRFASEIGVKIEATLATHLYTGIMYDTGRFIHSNTTPEVFQHCAGLVAAGADPSGIAINVYSKRSLSHLRLLGYVLDNFRTEENDTIAYIVTSREKFNELGASHDDNEGVVEEIGKYAGCEVHISFMELDGGLIRVSMRSVGNVNVGKICKKLGGGGHDFAAGIRIKDTLENAVESVLEETRDEVRRLGLADEG